VTGRQSWERQVAADLAEIKQRLRDLPCKENTAKLNALHNGATYNRGLRAGLILLLTGMGGAVGSVVARYGTLLVQLVDGK